MSAKQREEEKFRVQRKKSKRESINIVLYISPAISNKKVQKKFVDNMEEKQKTRGKFFVSEKLREEAGKYCHRAPTAMACN
jgi:hypothetical protein